MNWNSMGNSAFYNRKSPERLSKIIRMQPLISIRLWGGTNYYSYVQNNPINRIDPFGLKQVVVNTVGGVPIVLDTDTGRVTMGPKDNYVDPMTDAARDAINRSKDTVKDVCSNVAQEKATRTLVDKAPAALKPLVKWGSSIVGTIVDVLSPTDAW